MEVTINENIIWEELENEINWFDKVVDTALTHYFKNDSAINSIYDHGLETLNDNTTYAKLILQNEFGFDERLILILALIAQLRPQSLDVFMIKNQNLNCEFSEFGGVKNGKKVGFTPTLETACFILTGASVKDRLAFINNFTFDHPLFKQGILVRDHEVESSLDQPLRFTSEQLRFIFTGQSELPQYGSSFPAKQITSALEWDDLIVGLGVKEDLNEIEEWLSHSKLILQEWGFGNSLKNGFRALFYGAPGTGKTLAATLIGKSTKKPVFRIDLSMIVSKYIGETEKNLGNLFDIAQNKEWILFFDEADSLFGKRTQTSGANDRHANQEVSYLLQRIEDYPGLVILATNLKDNIDEAFGRRFQIAVEFQRPGPKERKQLWDNYLFDRFEIEENFPKDEIIEKYDVSGGEIINILRYCAIRAAKRNEKKITITDVLSGIQREYKKLNKTL